MKFFELYSMGHALAEEIDDFIEIWHSDETDTTESLAQFLGLEDDEYYAWVQDSKVLPFILEARGRGMDLDDLLHTHVDEMAFAARAADKTSLVALQNWLEKRQRHARD